MNASMASKLLQRLSEHRRGLLADLAASDSLEEPAAAALLSRLATVQACIAAVRDETTLP